MSAIKSPFKKTETAEKKKKATWPPPKKKWPRVLAGSLILLVLICVIVSLWPEKKPDDYLTYTQRYMPANTQAADFLVTFGKNVHSATIQPELWQNGQCTLGESMILGEDSPQLHALFSVGELNNARGIPSIQVQLDKSGTDESFLSRFLLPTSVTGYSYGSYSDHEIVEALPGESVILATVGMDLGSGVRGYSPAQLSDSAIQSAPCLLVIRAVFSAEEVPPVSSESESAGEISASLAESAPAA